MLFWMSSNNIVMRIIWGVIYHFCTLHNSEVMLVFCAPADVFRFYLCSHNKCIFSVNSCCWNVYTWLSLTLQNVTKITTHTHTQGYMLDILHIQIVSKVSGSSLTWIIIVIQCWLEMFYQLCEGNLNHLSLQTFIVNY